MNKENIKHIFLISILLLFWGIYSSISKLLLGDYDSMSLLFFMYLSSAITITLYMLITKKIKAIKRIGKRELVIYSLISLFSFLYYFLYFIALKNAPAIEITTINYLFPLLIAILAIPINKEKLTFKKWVALLLGLIGVFIILSKGNLSSIHFTHIKADIFAFIGALSWALLSNLSKKYVKRQESFTFIAIIIQFIACIFILPFFTSIHLPNITQIIGASWLGITNLVICFLIWQNLVYKLSASTVASISFITPFINIVAIVIILGEKMTLASLIGFLVVVIGITLQSIHLKKRIIN